jgi:signal transduction histidine kinase
MCIIAIIKFRSNFAKAKSIQKQQMQYFTIGISLTAFIALLTNLIFPMFLNIFSLTDLGPASSLIFIGFTTLAIIRYRLFDVKFLFGKLIYYLLIAFLPYISFYIFYFLLNGFSYKGGVVFYLFGIPASVFFLLIYDRMHNYISNFTDNRFIHPDYNPLKIIEQYRKDTTNKLEKNDIIETTLAYIAKTIRPELQGIIIAKDNDTIEITNYKNTQTDIEINQLKELFDYYGSTNNQALIYDEFQSPNSLALKIKRTLKRHKIKLALPLVLKNTAVGIIFLGMKEADYPYSTEEINFISILTNSLIQNLNRADIFEEAKRFNIELKQKVKEATTKLEKAYKQLKVLDEAKSDFISIASHQLRTPLSIIKGYLSMITEGDYGKINAEQLRVIEMSFNAVSDLSEIVNELLTSSRIERGKFTIDKTPVDIIELLNYVFKLYQNKYDKKGLSLKLITPKHQTKLIFNIDREKFEQVIVNLIENAYNYTPQGGVTVTLEEKKTSVILAVKDTGIGIPPEGKKKLFERFSRLDNAQNLRPDGTGIGLFTAKVIVEKHDGKIWFDSELGKGTTFFVEIPKA